LFADPPRPSQIIAQALQSGELSIDDVTPTREPIDDVDINISSSIDVLTGSMKELSMLPIPPTQQLHRNNIEDDNNINDKEDVSADVSRHDDEEDDEEGEDEDEEDGIEKRKGRDVSRCLCYHHHHHRNHHLHNHYHRYYYHHHHRY